MSRDHDPTSLSELPGPDDDPHAAALSRALAADAASIEPNDRFDEVHRSASARRWWPGAVAAVAAVAVLAAVGTQLLGTDHPGLGPSGASPTARGSAPVSSPASASGPSSTSSSPQSSTSSGEVAAVLPVYYLGRDGDRWALFREFHRRVVAGTAAARLQAALDDATTQRAVVDPDLSSPWTTRTDPPHVTRSGDVVTIDLPAAEAQPDGRTAQQARIAVQQLVWTATAVAQDANLGVRLLVGGAPGRLFGQEPVGDVVHRASPSYAVLGSIWIEAPDEGQTISSPVTVTGSACVFEGTVVWQLTRDGAQVSSGHTMASSGCPQRGTWRVALGALQAGTYTLRAYEPPASGSGPDREVTRTFVVR